MIRELTMDDTQKCRTSDANTTRKRRSSILKSQRPSRTPFSELEFNVATPTDTVKSRRVSFSRRTGVAEFVTNESTTTWKNFYEEHNKSLESSGNDLEVKAPRQAISHIGKWFDEQFEKVEAVDFLPQINTPSLNINPSLNNIHLTQQVASSECTDSIKLAAPQSKFELSTFTENIHSKLFGDDLTAPTMGEMSGQIGINFSHIHTINQETDDLDEIQKKVEKAHNDVMCMGPFTDTQNMSDYIEVDLNTTHITMRNEESDMSITDTIHSPKVQDVSKSCSFDKKLSQSKDWVTDKENIALNPYIAPRESANFAINEENDKVLVFDGKRLTLQSDNTNIPENDVRPQRRNTIVYENVARNMSVTQAIPSNIIVPESKVRSQKRNTNVDDIDTENISVTQGIPSNIILPENQTRPQRRNTIVYENDAGDISVSHSIHSNIILLEKDARPQRRNTIVYDNDAGNMSVTQAIPSDIILPENNVRPQRRNTIVYDNDAGNMSVTQAIPSDIILTENNVRPQRRNTIVYDNDAGNMSVTQAIPSDIILPENNVRPQRRNTIVYDNDAGNMSVTQAIPSDIILTENNVRPQRRNTIVYDNDARNMSVTQAIPSDIILPENNVRPQRRNTIVYDNDAGNMSVTQAIPSDIILPENNVRPQRRNTIVYDKDAGNISVTQAIPSNIILPESEARPQRRNTIVYDNDTGNISVTQAIPSNIIEPENNIRPQKRNTIVYENDAGNISVTQAIPSNIIVPEIERRSQRRNTIVYDVDAGNISVTQAISSHIILSVNEAPPQRRNTIVYDNDAGNISVTQAIPSDIILPENVARPQKRNTIVYDDDAGNISVTQTIPRNILFCENNTKRQTIVDDNQKTNTSTIQTIPNEIIMEDKTVQPDNDKSILFEDDVNNMYVSEAPIILREKKSSQRDNMMENRKSNFTLSELKNTILQQTGNAPAARKTTTNTRIIDEEILSEQKLAYHKTDLSNIPITTHSITNTLNTSESRYLIDKRNIVEIENDGKVIDLNDNGNNISVKALCVSIEPKLKAQEESPDKLCINTQKREGKNKCKSIEHGNDVADISMTPAYITSLTLEENRSKEEKVVVKDSDVIMKDIQPSYSIIGQVNDNAPNVQDKKQSKRNSMDVTMSAKQDVLPSPTNTKKKESVSPSYENFVSQDMIRDKKGFSDGNASITKPIPTMLLSIQREIIEEPDKECKMNIEPHTVNQEVLLYQVSTNHIETLEFKTNNQNNVNNERHPDEGKTIKTIVSDQEKNVSQSIEKANSKNMKCIINDECILDGSKRSTTDDFEIIDAKKAYDEINMNGNGISKESMDGGIDDKNEMAVVESNDQLSENAKSDENDENMFYITKDIDVDKKHSYEFKQNVSSSSYQEKKQDDSEEVDHLQKKLLELKSVIHDDTDSPPKNRHYEIIKCSDEENNAISRRETLNSTKERKSYKSADDTDYLLQMLSDLTENKASDIIEEEEKPKPIEVKGRIALENKSEVLDKRRISFIPKRQSIVLSREDLLNNISLAQAALQKSRYELDESEEDTEKDSSVEESPQKKVVRMSNEVVKTLHFEEDDTVSETSIKSDKLSPLKKTAFGETSYMKESKAKVIPSYLKDVSDGIKALMHDLVKPTADTMPFEAGLDQSLKKIPSTCSTEIQANLITSSQIDLNTELYSNPTSTYDIKTQAAYANEVLMSGNRAMAHPIKSPAKSFPILESEKSETEVTDESGNHVRYKQALHGQTIPAKVLVFDHENPLNNILLVPTDCAYAHKYNPVKSDETICDTARSHCEQKAVSGKDIEVERVAMQYNVDGPGPTSHVLQQSDFPSAQKIADVQSITSTTSKPMSIDQSVDVKMIEVKDTEINTSITMKGNKELLETSSSLTLVDDALAQNAFDFDVDTYTTISPSKFQAAKRKSPVDKKKINQIDECGIQSERIDSDLTSNDEESTKHKENKRKKRNYSSIKHKNTTPSVVDVTPKPTCKVQKMSTTPKNLIKTILEPHHSSPEKNKFTTQRSEQTTDEEMPSPGKVKNKSRRNSKDKTGTTITVHRLVTEYNNDINIDRIEQMHALANQSCNANAEHLDEAKSPEEACSFTSRNNVNDKDECSVATSSQPASEISMRSSSRVTWQPDLINEISSKNLVSECESSVNVVAKIDMFPFMGSNECEWEWSCADSWAFRLLHGRLRLCVRLAHRHDNAARTCVRADTPVRAISVEIAHYDKKNSVAMTCVRFAAETMRYLCAAAGGAGGAGVAGGAGAEGVRAGDVPALLRRCAAAARVASRWGRAMQAARARLAFRLSEDGQLSLKVANVSLRSVWEVCMRLELVVQECGAPWPRAGDVRVSPLVSEWRVSDAHVRAALAAVPADWGHVPRTVWKIFKYLKNKTRDDDLLAV